MTDGEVQTIAVQNSRDIAELKQVVNTLIAEVIRPMSENFVAMQQNIAVMQQNIEDNAERSADNAQRIAENAQRIADNAQRTAENDEQFRILLAEAREDRTRAQERFDAQQAEIKELLSRIGNRDSDDNTV